MTNVQLIATARHYEALSARAWPAAQEIYDRLWLKRITPMHPSQRINCVMPLDPGDDYLIKQRLAQLCFDENGQFKFPLRQTPLCSPKIIAYMQKNAWVKADEIALMRLDLQDFAIEPKDKTKQNKTIEIEELSAKDYVALSAKIYNGGKKPQNAFLDIIARIKGQPSFLQFRFGNKIIGNILIVEDHREIGLLDFAVDANYRRQGLGAAALQSLISKIQGENKIAALWLHVEDDNKNAIALYQKYNFKTLYTISNWSARI